MTDPTLFVTDIEIVRRLGLGEKTGRRQIRHWCKMTDGRPFPRKFKGPGNRRYWPDVRAWLDERFGATDKTAAKPAILAENPHAFAARPSRRKPDQRASVAPPASHGPVDRVLGRKAGVGEAGVFAQDGNVVRIPRRTDAG